MSNLFEDEETIIGSTKISGTLTNISVSYQELLDSVKGLRADASSIKNQGRSHLNISFRVVFVGQKELNELMDIAAEIRVNPILPVHNSYISMLTASRLNDEELFSSIMKNQFGEGIEDYDNMIAAINLQDEKERRAVEVAIHEIYKNIDQLIKTSSTKINDIPSNVINQSIDRFIKYSAEMSSTSSEFNQSEFVSDVMMVPIRSHLESQDGGFIKYKYLYQQIGNHLKSTLITGQDEQSNFMAPILNTSGARLSLVRAEIERHKAKLLRPTSEKYKSSASLSTINMAIRDINAATIQTYPDTVAATFSGTVANLDFLGEHVEYWDYNESSQKLSISPTIYRRENENVYPTYFYGKLLERVKSNDSEPIKKQGANTEYWSRSIVKNKMCRPYSIRGTVASYNFYTFNVEYFTKTDVTNKLDELSEAGELSDFARKRVGWLSETLGYGNEQTSKDKALEMISDQINGVTGEVSVFGRQVRRKSTPELVREFKFKDEYIENKQISVGNSIITIPMANSNRFTTQFTGRMNGSAKITMSVPSMTEEGVKFIEELHVMKTFLENKGRSEIPHERFSAILIDSPLFNMFGCYTWSIDQVVFTHKDDKECSVEVVLIESVVPSDDPDEAGRPKRLSITERPLNKNQFSESLNPGPDIDARAESLIRSCKYIKTVFEDGIENTHGVGNPSEFFLSKDTLLKTMKAFSGSVMYNFLNSAYDVALIEREDVVFSNSITFVGKHLTERVKEASKFADEINRFYLSDSVGDSSYFYLKGKLEDIISLSKDMSFLSDEIIKITKMYLVYHRRGTLDRWIDDENSNDNFVVRGVDNTSTSDRLTKLKELIGGQDSLRLVRQIRQMVENGYPATSDLFLEIISDNRIAPGSFENIIKSAALKNIARSPDSFADAAMKRMSVHNDMNLPTYRDVLTFSYNNQELRESISNLEQLLIDNNADGKFSNLISDVGRMKNLPSMSYDEISDRLKKFVSLAKRTVRKKVVEPYVMTINNIGQQNDNQSLPFMNSFQEAIKVIDLAANSDDGEFISKVIKSAHSDISRSRPGVRFMPTFKDLGRTPKFFSGDVSGDGESGYNWNAIARIMDSPVSPVYYMVSREIKGVFTVANSDEERISKQKAALLEYSRSMNGNNPVTASKSILINQVEEKKKLDMAKNISPSGSSKNGEGNSSSAGFNSLGNSTDQIQKAIETANNLKEHGFNASTYPVNAQTPGTVFSVDDKDTEISDITDQEQKSKVNPKNSDGDEAWRREMHSKGISFELLSNLRDRAFNHMTVKSASAERLRPTFALFFVKKLSDYSLEGSYKETGDDHIEANISNDLYFYSIVDFLKITRSQEEGSLAVMNINDTYGHLSNNSFDLQHARKSAGQTKHHKLNVQNQFDLFFRRSINLSPGTMIQVRMGYGCNAWELEPVFNGRIAEVSNQAGAISLVAQGYESELLEPLDYRWGPTDDIVHGRNFWHIASEVLSTATSFGGVVSNKGLNQRISSEIQRARLIAEERHVGVQSRLGPKYMSKISVLWNSVCDNIRIKNDGSSWDIFTCNSFKTNGKTGFETLKEVTRFYPGNVMGVKNYDFRATCFIGEPDNDYLYTSQMGAEAFNWLHLRKSLSSFKPYDINKSLRDNRDEAIEKVESSMTDLFAKIIFINEIDNNASNGNHYSIAAASYSVRIMLTIVSARSALEKAMSRVFESDTYEQSSNRAQLIIRKRFSESVAFSDLVNIQNEIFDKHDSISDGAIRSIMEFFILYIVNGKAPRASEDKLKLRINKHEGGQIDQMIDYAMSGMKSLSDTEKFMKDLDGYSEKDTIGINSIDGGSNNREVLGTIKFRVGLPEFLLAVRHCAAMLLTKDSSGIIGRLIDPSALDQYNKKLKAMKSTSAPPGTKPFRRYHYIGADDIVTNNIECTTREMSNEVWLESPGGVTFTGGLVKDLVNSLFGIEFSRDTQVNKYYFDMFTRGTQKLIYTVNEDNAYTERMKDMQGAMHLKNEMGKMYRGSVTIIGKADLEEHDIVFIDDPSRRIKGMFEVDRVTHIMDSQNGFLTTIEPKAIVESYASTDYLLRQNIAWGIQAVDEVFNILVMFKGASLLWNLAKPVLVSGSAAIKAATKEGVKKTIQAAAASPAAKQSLADVITGGASIAWTMAFEKLANIVGHDIIRPLWLSHLESEAGLYRHTVMQGLNVNGYAPCVIAPMMKDGRVWTAGIHSTEQIGYYQLLLGESLQNFAFAVDYGYEAAGDVWTNKALAIKRFWNTYNRPELGL